MTDSTTENQVHSKNNEAHISSHTNELLTTFASIYEKTELLLEVLPEETQPFLEAAPWQGPAVTRTKTVMDATVSLVNIKAGPIMIHYA